MRARCDASHPTQANVPGARTASLPPGVRASPGFHPGRVVPSRVLATLRVAQVDVAHHPRDHARLEIILPVDPLVGLDAQLGDLRRDADRVLRHRVVELGVGRPQVGAIDREPVFDHGAVHDLHGGLVRVEDSEIAHEESMTRGWDRR